MPCRATRSDSVYTCSFDCSMNVTGTVFDQKGVTVPSSPSSISYYFRSVIKTNSWPSLSLSHSLREAALARLSDPSLCFRSSIMEEPKADGAPKAADTAAAASVAGSSAQEKAPRLSCTKCFDALWFCYSPFHQMQQYYRYGEFDNCFSKWSTLYDCLSLKTKRTSEVQEILEAREKAKQHIWTYRTVEEASMNWWRMYNHLFKLPPKPDV